MSEGEHKEEEEHECYWTLVAGWNMYAQGKEAMVVEEDNKRGGD